ncbi:hypothetical protein OS175_12440 [Marinicella sp. S1101]|uniref:hypothetical protein n=1 Tax=Marinicella marina TaxID=2996016 RepID=UPI002260A675|nr:hypothetical protein [Marinicella marina]MCX7554690.1 hypothetical protein [Marinicella marina]MDJ1141494.1 hypothetical protein [Marinicella marina]
MKLLILLLLLLNVIDCLGAGSVWRCSEVFTDNKINKLLNKEIIPVELDHQFDLSATNMQLKTFFNNENNISLHVLRWNNFDSPLIRVYALRENNELKFINSKSEIHAQQNDRVEDMDCSTETIYDKNTFKNQFIAYDLKSSYDFSPTETYCIESKELFLFDLINHKTIKTTSPDYLVYYSDQWNVKEVKDDLCAEYKNGLIEHKEILNLINNKNKSD